MFSTNWETSARQFGVIEERDVRIPVDEGISLDSDIFRPDAPVEWFCCAGRWGSRTWATGTRSTAESSTATRWTTTAPGRAVTRGSGRETVW